MIVAIRRCGMVLVLLAGAAAPLAAQEAPAGKAADSKEAKPASADPIERIKDEGLNRSQVMETAKHLTDVIGPRLTGSPQLKRANEWTRDTMSKWGLENAHLEAWGPFGRGWELMRFSAQVVEPQNVPLIAFPKAWSPGLDTPVVSDVVLFNPKTSDEVDSFKGRLGGKVVMLSDEREVKALFDPPAVRQTDKQLLDLANAPDPDERFRTPGPGGPPPRRGGMPAFFPGMDPAQMALRRKKADLLAAEPPVALLEASPRGDGGTLFVQSASASPGTFSRGGKRVWDKDAPPKVIPQFVVAIEHYNRLIRMVQAGEPVKVALELNVKVHTDDPMVYNTVAEIPGTDKKDELVMLGGHMDSWHSGTGATDNAAGVSVAMEAARIIKALDLKPRRTIRVALWTGEEQGLLGSEAYVKAHFGTNEPDSLARAVASWVGGQPRRTFKPGPEHDRLSAYFNLDNGSGKIRGIYCQGNEKTVPIFRHWLTPFGEMGANTVTLANTGGTDHLSFASVGLPGFQFIQDGIEYSSRTHHSNQDTFDRLQADDLKQASVVMAAFVYNAAMADEKLPREEMPK